MERENWINDIIETTNQIKKVEPRDRLFTAIKNKIMTQNKVDFGVLWLVAASMLVLVSLNIKVVLSEIQSKNQVQSAVLAATLTDSNQFYTLNND